MAGDLERFLSEVEAESTAAGKRADLDAYARHFEMARQLLQLRRSKGWTQVELAEASGVQQSEISRIERGQGNPTLQTMAQLASAFGMRLAFVRAPAVKPSTQRRPAKPRAVSETSPAPRRRRARGA